VDTVITDAALDAIEAGRTDLLGAIFAAAQELNQVEPLLAAATVALLNDEEDEPQGEPLDWEGLVKRAAASAEPLQRRAMTIRLRGFRYRQPEHPRITRLLSLLGQPAQP